MMRVLCYGDSNTYGYDPRSYCGGRYPADSRWVDLLAEKTGWEIRNEGMNGREIPRSAIPVPENTDLLIVMLGSNDLLQGAGADAAADRMEAFCSGLNFARNRIVLIAPPPLKRGEWVPHQSLIDASLSLAQSYQALSERLGIRFADAGGWNVSLAFDGVHFTEAGHKAFAEGLYQFLNSCINFE